jgi:hypothetical protein
MSLQSAFPFAVLAVGLGIALHQVREDDGGPIADVRPAVAVTDDASCGPETRPGVPTVVPAALRRTAGVGGLRVAIDAIEARLVGGRVIRVDNLEAAGTRRACSVQPSSAGVECPDGTRLPLLNCLDEAPPIQVHPGVERLAPVIAIVVDADGWEWYEHADGSRTTTRLQAVESASGDAPAVRPVTLHEAAGTRGRPVDGVLRQGRANLDR